MLRTAAGAAAADTGTSAFETFAGCGYFEYITKPENSQEEEVFNRMMTTFTKTMDSAAKLHVSHTLQNCRCRRV